MMPSLSKMRPPSSSSFESLYLPIQFELDQERLDGFLIRVLLVQWNALPIRREVGDDIVRFQWWRLLFINAVLQPSFPHHRFGSTDIASMTLDEPPRSRSVDETTRHVTPT
ncbi:hypothetical protein QJS04_geneDACA008464 [Acorus gramineus]|uniref:Uncharacterized protein n=1 Tax=Acorus gramineus TaxID=55184 RepID=A0AAV9AI72_ACOGR|nr:hypothetical protein QJS04_geneDACA008464 [Acorus gramineus]